MGAGPPSGAPSINSEASRGVSSAVGYDRLSAVMGPIHSYLAVETTTVSDSGNTMVVLVVTFLLVLAGAALAALGYWYWKSTIPDPESLGPLHSMSSRSFSSLDEVEQRRALDSLRPSLAAIPSTPDVAPTRAESDIEVDAIEPEPVARDQRVFDELVAEPTVPAPVVPSTESRRREVAAFEFDDEDESWPGDDWSDLDALQSSEPEILSEIFHEEPRSRRSARRNEEPGASRDVAPAPAPIDPLIG